MDLVAFFRRLYNKVLDWSTHRHAPYYLAGVSFVESSVFPIPPDVMLIPMVLSKPLKAWQYAVITTLASVFGGILGYTLGLFAFELVGEPIIQSFGYQVLYAKVENWFAHYGFWAVFIAGFTPIPYKVFTIAAGASQMPLIPFIIASIFGRSLRFFIVVWMVKGIGKKLEPLIVKYIEILAWAVLGIIGIGVLIYFVT